MTSIPVTLADVGPIKPTPSDLHEHWIASGEHPDLVLDDLRADRRCVQTHDAYQEAQDDLVHALHNLADEIPPRLAAFDDDGHMRHLNHALGIVAAVNHLYAEMHLIRLIEAAARADEAIHQARNHQ
jgi:hypothetical protein